MQETCVKARHPRWRMLLQSPLDGGMMRDGQAMRCLCAGLLLAVVAFSGCTDAGSDGMHGTRVNPSTLQAPTWQVGDAWHYATPDGMWQNWTVVDLDERDGYETYRLELRDSIPKDPSGNTRTTVWMDRSTLGVVAIKAEDGATLTANPPMTQLFPMINRTYDTSMDFNSYGSQKVRFQQQVDGWHSISTPAGEFDTILILVQSEARSPNGEPVSPDKEPVPSWYSPAVESVVQFQEDDQMYQLMSWGRE